MRWIDVIHTILLMVLIDRSLVIRKRYKIGIETWNGNIAIWIYFQRPNEEQYWRYKYIIGFKYKGK